MADAPDEKKVESTPIDYKEIFTVIAWLCAILCVIFLVVLFLLIDQETAQNFLYFLYGLEILSIFYIAFFGFKWWENILRFREQNGKLEEIYNNKYKPVEEDKKLRNPLEQRYDRSKLHIGSKYQEEWKIGIIELDTILKDLLKVKYKGDTVGELLIDAEKNGLKNVQIAWEAHNVRNKVVHEGVNYVIDKSFAERTLRNYSIIFDELGLK